MTKASKQLRNSGRWCLIFSLKLINLIGFFLVNKFCVLKMTKIFHFSWSATNAIWMISAKYRCQSVRRERSSGAAFHTSKRRQRPAKMSIRWLVKIVYRFHAQQGYIYFRCSSIWCEKFARESRRTHRRIPDESPNRGERDGRRGVHCSKKMTKSP